MQYRIGQNVEFKIDSIIESNDNIKTQISLVDDPYIKAILYIHSSQKIFNKFEQNQNIIIDKDEIFNGWISRINKSSITICFENFGREKTKLYFAVFYMEAFEKLKGYILSAIDETIDLDGLDFKYFSRVSHVIMINIKNWQSADYFLLYESINMENAKLLEEIGHIITEIRTQIKAYNEGELYNRYMIIGRLKELYALGFIEHIDSLLRYIDNLYYGISIKEFIQFKEENLNLSYFYKFKEYCFCNFPNEINLKERYDYVNKIRNIDYIKNINYDEILYLLKSIGAKNAITIDMVSQIKESLEYIICNEDIDMKIKTLTQKKGLKSLTVCSANKKESGLTKADIVRLIIYLNPKDSYLFDDESLIVLKILGINPQLSKSYRKTNREFINTMEEFNIVDTYLEIVGKQTDYHINYEIEEFLKFVIFCNYNCFKMNNKLDKIYKDIEELKIKFQDEVQKMKLYIN